MILNQFKLSLSYEFLYATKTGFIKNINSDPKKTLEIRLLKAI